MKKYLFYFVLGLFFGVCTIKSYAAQRPLPFFVPQKVLNKMNQPEKLPPPEQMFPNNRQISAAKAEQQNNQNEMLKKQQKNIIDKKQEKEPQIKQKTEITQNVPTKPISEIKQTTDKVSTPAADDANNVRDTDKKQNPVIINTKNKANAKENAAETKDKDVSVKMQDESMENTPVLNNSQRTFDDIIADYRRDAFGISQGKPVNNPRLRDVLQDYSDERHIL